MVSTKLEVLVEFGGKCDESSIVRNTIEKLKKQNGVKDIQFQNGAFMVETTLPSSDVLELVTKFSGRRSVLQGFGEKESAVSMVSSFDDDKIKGIVRFQQNDDILLVDGTVDGLRPGDYSLNVHETGDISKGCDSIGPIYKKMAGELGTVHGDDNGRANFRIVNNVLKVSEIIGRSVALSEVNRDVHSKDNWIRVACGVIARSAGIFQNPKRICACDGVVVWDERDRPLAGKGRRKETDDSEKKCCCNKL